MAVRTVTVPDVDDDILSKTAADAPTARSQVSSFLFVPALAALA
jgi:hypothetical protein